jgi:hypothetical protein
MSVNIQGLKLFLRVGFSKDPHKVPNVDMKSLEALRDFLKRDHEFLLQHQRKAVDRVPSDKMEELLLHALSRVGTTTFCQEEFLAKSQDDQAVDLALSFTYYGILEIFIELALEELKVAPETFRAKLLNRVEEKQKETKEKVGELESLFEGVILLDKFKEFLR